MSKDDTFFLCLAWSFHDKGRYLLNEQKNTLKISKFITVIILFNYSYYILVKNLKFIVLFDLVSVVVYRIRLWSHVYCKIQAKRLQTGWEVRRFRLLLNCHSFILNITQKAFYTSADHRSEYGAFKSMWSYHDRVSKKIELTKTKL